MGRHDGKAYKVTREANAWDSIGWDNGLFRIKGGRTVYEAVMYNCATGGRMVLLARLEPTEDHRLKQVNRYVEPDTILEFLEEISCSQSAKESQC